MHLKNMEATGADYVPSRVTLMYFPGSKKGPILHVPSRPVNAIIINAMWV